MFRIFKWFRMSPVVPDRIRDKLRELDWPPTWRSIEPQFSDELYREVGRGHPLYGRDAIAIARGTNSDDVLFWLPDGPAGFAEVHLTWTGQRETSPQWPATRFFSSFEDWVQRGMHAEEANKIPREPRVVGSDDFVLPEDLEDSFRCCPNRDPFPYKCSDCGLPLVFCRECDTLYPSLPDTSRYGEVNSFDSKKPSHHCPRCGHAFEYSFMKNPAYRITYAEWRAAGLEQLLQRPE